MKRLPLLAVIILTIAAPALSQNPNAAPSRSGAAGDRGRSVDELRRVQQRRFAATIRADRKELERLLADDLTYTHSNGLVDTKSSLLAALTSGRVAYVEIAPSEIQVRRYGATGILTGRARLAVRARGQENRFPVRFTEVYVKRGGRWQMVAWQSTRLPDEP